VNKELMDQNAELLREALRQARIGNNEKRGAIMRLKGLYA